MKLEQLYLSEGQMRTIERAKKLKTLSFWGRQFQTKQTRKQKVFDGIFGIILPVICFSFDPIVFKGGIFSEGAILATYKPFAYSLSFVSIMLLLAFMLWEEKLKWINGFLSGIFAIGGFISLIVGIVLFPFSLLGLIILIGILGFTPLITAFVFFRNAVRAYKTAQPYAGKRVLINSFALSVIFSLVLPFLLNIKAQKGLETMKNGDVQTIRATAEKFRYVSPLVNFDSLAWEYDLKNPNSERNIALADSFNQLTGGDLKTLKEAKLNMRMAE